MTNQLGQCAEKCKISGNGITVKADKEFGAIELAFVVDDRKIGCFLTVKEAEDIVEAIKDAVAKMIDVDEMPNSASEELKKINETNAVQDGESCSEETNEEG